MAHDRHHFAIHQRQASPRVPDLWVQGYFWPSGTQPVIFDAALPQVSSIGRHRQHYLLVSHHREWIDGRDILHFAPEPSLVKDYTQRARKYVRADYDPASDELKIDLQAIDFPNDSFDLIICHNVIEHVPDDRKGLTEMFRVLRPGRRGVDFRADRRCLEVYV